MKNNKYPATESLIRFRHGKYYSGTIYTHSPIAIGNTYLLVFRNGRIVGAWNVKKLK